jgi:hypothetical protein
MEKWIAIFAKESEEGQSLVELAVVSVLLIFILVAVVDLGRAYFIFLALQDAAGEGAAYGTIHPTWCQEDDNPSPNNIAYRVRHESPSGMISWDDTTVLVTAPFPTPGNTISVTVIYNYPLITPFMGALAGGGTLPVRAQAVQTILASDGDGIFTGEVCIDEPTS